MSGFVYLLVFRVTSILEQWLFVNPTSIKYQHSQKGYIALYDTEYFNTQSINKNIEKPDILRGTICYTDVYLKDPV